MRIRSEKGAQLVEFAIIAPLLFFLLFGIIEWGAVLYDYVTLRNLSRASARFAATFYLDPSSADPLATPCSKSCSDIITFLQNNHEVVTHMLNFVNPTSAVCCPGGTTCTQANPVNPIILTPSCADDGSGGNVYSVKASYSFNFVIINDLIRFLNNGNSLTIAPVSTMRDEAPAQ